MSIQFKFPKALSLVCVFVVVFFCGSFAQKAYDAIYYTGKTQNIKAKLTIGDGYIEASEIKTTDLTTKKTSTFLYNQTQDLDSEKMKLYHYSRYKTFTDYFIIEGIDYSWQGFEPGKIPDKVYGYYYCNSIAYKIIFTRIKE